MAAAATVPQPVIIWNGETAFLVVEKEVICTLPANEAPVALLAAYYNFDIAYPKGCRQLMTSLEILLLNKMPKKVPAKVSTLLSAIQNVM